MTRLGEIKYAREIGRKDGRGAGKWIWSACIDCGKERWVKYLAVTNNLV